MGWYVHIHVCFACDDNDGVGELARQYREKMDEDTPDVVIWFLEELSKRTGNNPGPKGGLSMWGMIGNHTSVEEFVEILKPFWNDLLLEKADGGPFNFEHIIVFEEQEQSEQAKAYEIFLGGEEEDIERPVVVKKHDLPFAWMQM